MVYLILLIFALELWLGETRGDSAATVERSSRALAAVAMFGVLIAGYLLTLGRDVSPRKAPRIPRTSYPVFWILGTWVLVSGAATLLGFTERYDPNYILGDLFKFCLLPLLFVLVYFGIRKPRQFETLLKGYVVVFGIALLVAFMQMSAWVEGGGRFANSASYHIATLEPLIIYLFIAGNMTRWFRVVLWAVIAETLISIVLLQGWSDYLSAFFALFLFFLYFRRTKLALAVALVPVLAVVGILDPWNLFGPTGSYAARKLQYALQGGTFSSASFESTSFEERVLGSRVSELNAVGRAFANDPAKLLTGFGTGGTIQALPITGISSGTKGFRVSWVPVKHFIHSGLAEVLYRTGAPGLLTLLGFFGLVYYRGRKIAQGYYREYGLFVMANAVFQLQNIALETSLAYVWLILVISLVGTFILEAAPAARQSESRAPSDGARRFGRTVFRPSEAQAK